jgi:hypothetical protein
MAQGRWRLVAASTAAVVCLGACTAAPEPGEPTPTGAPTTAPSPTPSASAPTPTPSASASAPASSPTASMSGLTLRQLGFENGPLDEFSLPSDLVVSTAVDQPNVVTIVLAGPSPQTVEDHLRATLPNEGFTIDARADAGEALTFEGNGWTGGFTGTGATSAIVLRPV